MRLLLALVLMAAAPAPAQWRRIELRFDGVGCASCMESMPARVKRLRGVETAVVDAGMGVLTVTLAPANRVRLEQIRDFIEQDGTKAISARVEVRGEALNDGGKTTLKPGTIEPLLVQGGGEWKAGQHYVVRGTIEPVRGTEGPLVLKVTTKEAAPGGGL